MTDIEACLLSLLDSNPYLEVQAEGNPLKNPLGTYENPTLGSALHLCSFLIDEFIHLRSAAAIQQWKEKKARRQQQSLRMATNRISVDIFALLKMHSKARNSVRPLSLCFF